MGMQVKYLEEQALLLVLAFPEHWAWVEDPQMFVETHLRQLESRLVRS